MEKIRYRPSNHDMKSSFNKEIVYVTNLLGKEIAGNVGRHPLFFKHFLSNPPEGYIYKIAKHQTKLSINKIYLKFNRFVLGNYVKSDVFSPVLYKSIFKLFNYARKNAVDFEIIDKFIRSRNYGDTLFYTANSEGLLLFSTYALTLPDLNRPWIIEIEDVITLFDPFLKNGDTKDIDIHGAGFFKLFKRLYESPHCKRIITHMKSTADSIPSLFGSESITNKISYIPPAVDVPVNIKIDYPKNEINILFSNSWHQQEGGFFFRGGIDAIIAFIFIAKQYPDVSLIIRSTIPDNVKMLLKDLILEKRIQIFEDKLDSKKWDEIKSKCHIYLLPAARIHVASLLEAMSCGMAVICSDGWGFEEYIEDGVNGLIVSGRYGNVSWIDSENGLLREYYSPMFAENESVIIQIMAKIEYLMENPERFLEIRKTARQTVEDKYSTAKYDKSFKRVLDDIYSEGNIGHASLKNKAEKKHIDDSILPLFFDELVLTKDETGRYIVKTSEDYHLDNENILFSSFAYLECLDYINRSFKDNGNNIKSNKEIIIMKKIYRYTSVIKSNNNSGDKGRKLIIYAGKVKPFVDTKVGSHPVFNFVNYPPEGYSFRYHDEFDNYFFIRLYRLIFIYVQIIFLASKAIVKGIPLSFVKHFFKTRGGTQYQVEMPVGSKTTVLYPTYPFTYGQHSWFIEIEDMLTLMVPFCYNGNPNIELNKESSIIRMLEIMFESSRFKGVICHLKSTADGLREIYSGNRKVKEKIFHIPLGMSLDSPVYFQKKNITDNKKIKILFMSGWAQDPRASFRRGLLNALESFDRLCKINDDAVLILRTKLPSLRKKYMDLVEDGVKSRRIVLIENKLSKSDIEKIYHDSDILLFPAYRMAVTTLLQAMAHSLAIVASDGYGIEEYIKDGVNGLIARGIYGKSGYIDKQGIFREDYVCSLDINEEVVNNSVRLMKLLIEDKKLMNSIQFNARKAVDDEFSMEMWNKRFADVLAYSSKLKG